MLVFVLTRLGLEPAIYRTLDKHTHHYTADEVPYFEKEVPTK